MALPQQAVEKMAQEPVATQGAYKELLVLATALLILMLVLYFGIAFGYKAYLKNSISGLDKNIAKFGESIPQSQQDQTAQFYSALVNLRELLKTHTTASPVLAVLEATINPNIYLTKLTLNTTTNEADLTGAAKNLSDAAALVATLEKQPQVTRVNFTNAGNQNGIWQFTMSVFMDPNVLHANGSTAPNPGSQANVPLSGATSTPSGTVSPPASTSTPSSTSR
jgi:hypothetical protein